MDELTPEQLDAIANRFDPDQDGFGIGNDASADVLYAANFVISHPTAGISRDYIARIQERDLLAHE